LGQPSATAPSNRQSIGDQPAPRSVLRVFHKTRPEAVFGHLTIKRQLLQRQLMENNLDSIRSETDWHSVHFVQCFSVQWNRYL
jgi:hypothetical protein